MRAIQYTTYGGPEVLEVVDVPDPKMFIDQVRVQIRSAGLNPVDLGFQSGAVDALVDSLFPVTPGWDMAGVVEAVGPATSGLTPGDEVLGYVRGQVQRYGTYAEKISFEPNAFVRKPAQMSWEQAAGLPLAGLTAYQAIVHSLGVVAGETVLVHGAAGGVGHLAVQIAVARGATVIGTGSAASQEFITSLGALSVQYGDQLAQQVLALAPNGVDVVLDTAGRGSLAGTPALAKPVVRVASITRGEEYPDTIQVYMRSDRDDLERLVELVEAGALTVRVQHSLPLEQAKQAQEIVAEGHVHGKVVLTTGQQS